MELIADAYIVVLVVILTFGSAIFAKIYRKRRGINHLNQSVLLNYYIINQLYGAPKTQLLNGIHYSTYIAGNTGALIYRIELPFLTRYHLVGIPRSNHVEQLNPAAEAGSLLERLVLEGDYQNYFNLYIDKASQVEARVALNPKAMAFTVDFCRSHSWEIVNNELYFVQASEDNPEDPTSMFEDIAAFVDEIRPAIQNSDKIRRTTNLVPYGEERRQALPCPICQRAMPLKDNYFTCLHGHGALLSARSVIAYGDGKLTISMPRAQSKKHGPIPCPSCGATMLTAMIDGITTPIDSCPNCTYRWIDAQEFKHA
jgi:hypothetical protein